MKTYLLLCFRKYPGSQRLLVQILLYFSESFAVLKAMLHFKRLLPYYIYHVYIPCACLVVLSWSTFWIPFNAIPGRVTLIVTNFLTSILIFNEVGTSKAKAPYPTAIELYALANTTFIFFAMVEYILVLAQIQNIKYVSICTFFCIILSNQSLQCQLLTFYIEQWWDCQGAPKEQREEFE